MIADPRCLLHVVSDDQDRVLTAEPIDQILDLTRGDRIQGRTRLVEQENFRVACDGSGDAQALLLTTREA
jgi:hypothetical protein